MASSFMDTCYIVCLKQMLPGIKCIAYGVTNWYLYAIRIFKTVIGMLDFYATLSWSKYPTSFLLRQWFFWVHMQYWHIVVIKKILKFCRHLVSCIVEESVIMSQVMCQESIWKQTNLWSIYMKCKHVLLFFIYLFKLCWN